MRKTIAAMMAQGMSLEDIHTQMEQILNEEYNKREQEEEQKQKKIEIAAARDRAARSFIDYVTLTMGGVLDDTMNIEEVGQMLDEAIAEACIKIDIMEALCAPEKIEIKKVDADSDDEAIRKFLMGLGLQPMN